MKYFILFNIFSIVIFILLLLAHALDNKDVENENADNPRALHNKNVKTDPGNQRDILVYVSCGISFLCFALLQLSIKREENPSIPFIWPYTMVGFVLCAVSSIALGDVAIYETKDNADVETRANAVSNIPRIVCIILINLVILICMKRLIVLKYDSKLSSKREFVPRKIISKKIFTL